MKLKVIFISVVCNVAIILPTMIWAGEVTQELSALSDEEVSQRLHFIEQRLDEGRRHTNYWQIGWTGFYAISGTVQGTAAFMTDDGDNRANYIVGATKSALALKKVEGGMRAFQAKTQLLSPEKMVTQKIRSDLESIIELGD